MDSPDPSSHCNRKRSRRASVRLGGVLGLAAALLLGADLASAACVGCTSFAPTCEWQCNGNTYAWEIRLYVDPASPDSGPGVLMVDSTVDYCDEQENVCIPFYLYMPRAVWLQECNNLPGGCYIDGTTVVEVYSNIFDGNPETNYVVPTGNILNGQVIGVAKGAGDWHPVHANLRTSELTVGISSCSNSRSWAIGIVNAYGDFTHGGGLPNFPNLQCIPQPGIPDITVSDLNEPQCLPPNILNDNDQQFMVGVDGDFWDYMAKIDDCHEQNSPNLPPGGTSNPSCGGNAGPWEAIDKIRVPPLDNQPERIDKIRIPPPDNQPERNGKKQGPVPRESSRATR